MMLKEVLTKEDKEYFNQLIDTNFIGVENFWAMKEIIYNRALIRKLEKEIADIRGKENVND